jgi:hypothetical protein
MFIVQARFSHNGKLLAVQTLEAKTATHAIIEAGKMLVRSKQEAVELIATEQ